MDLDQKELRRLFTYNKKTGRLLNRIDRGQARKGGLVGGPTSQGYLKCKVHQRWHPVHRLIWIFHFGQIPDGYEIDHINFIRDDNHIENLQALTPTENRERSYVNRSHQGAGVTFHKRTRKWFVRLMIGGVRRGYKGYSTKTEAIRVAAQIRALLMVN
ncbi:HNH endonuclease [Bradyrhizobium sp. AUGA SZCCT0431]|uniref:HNH endonuclease n=1 Tax=Bradyrhizobium sp. AUGA SZCCT0431 TaxID=2807674 RepID=UPI001BAD1AF7|nr:HNH endonuclease [Bradyrhizobium sp. AUGA SZCCT0431]